MVIESIPMLLPFTWFGLLNSKSSFASDLKWATASLRASNIKKVVASLQASRKQRPEHQEATSPRTSRVTSSRANHRLRLEPQEGNVSQEGRPFGTHGLKGSHKISNNNNMPPKKADLSRLAALLKAYLAHKDIAAWTPPI
ncbi:hypothetical protein FSST1_000036 [Fusarium sambucinum]